MILNEKGFVRLPEEPDAVKVKIEKATSPPPRKLLSIRLPSVQRTWQLLVAVAILVALASAILVSLSSRYYLLNVHDLPFVYRIDRWTGKTERGYLNRWTTIQESPKR